MTYDDSKFQSTVSIKAKPFLLIAYRLIDGPFDTFKSQSRETKPVQILGCMQFHPGNWKCMFIAANSNAYSKNQTRGGTDIQFYSMFHTDVEQDATNWKRNSNPSLNGNVTNGKC